ncbi:MAG: hypothetical protein Q8M94_15645, partial [Ignavibacteria bacterium]|nr:hypothetical protein [Ignavibacteria bacterium]
MNNEIVVDIETIPNMQLPREVLDIAVQKASKKRSGNNDVSKYQSLTPEFGQIICAAIGERAADST